MGVAAHLQAMTDNDLTVPGPEVPAGHCTQHAVHDPACLSCRRAAVDLAVATGRPLPEFWDEDMRLRRDPDVDLAAMDRAVGRAASRPVRDRSSSSLAQAWSAWLDLALDQTIDDGKGGQESLLGLVLATNPNLRTRLGAVLAGHAEGPTVETEAAHAALCDQEAVPGSPDLARVFWEAWLSAAGQDSADQAQAGINAVLTSVGQGVTAEPLDPTGQPGEHRATFNPEFTHPGDVAECHWCRVDRPAPVVADSAGVREQVREAVYHNSSYLPGVQADERNVEQITDAVLAVVGRDRREVGRFLPDGRYTLVVEAGRARIDQLPAAAEGARA